MKNPTSTPQRIRSVTTTGTYRLDSTCPSVLAAGASCTVTVRFVPTATGDHGGAVTISDGTSAGRYQVYVTGVIGESTGAHQGAGAPRASTPPRGGTRGCARAPATPNVPTVST